MVPGLSDVSWLQFLITLNDGSTIAGGQCESPVGLRKSDGGKMEAGLGTLQIMKIVRALQKAGESLKSKEQDFLTSHATDSIVTVKLLEKTCAQIGGATVLKYLQLT